MKVFTHLSGKYINKYIFSSDLFTGVSKPIAFFYRYPLDLSDYDLRLQYLEMTVFNQPHCNIPSPEWNERFKLYAKKYLCHTR